MAASNPGSMSRRDLLKVGAGLSMSPAMLAMCGSTAAAADPYADAKLVSRAPPQPEAGGFYNCCSARYAKLQRALSANLPGANQLDRREPQGSKHLLRVAPGRYHEQ